MKPHKAISHAGQPTLSKPLRLWPVVVSGVVLALGWSVLAGLFPEAMLWGMAGVIAAVVAIAIWWLFFSRAPWTERVGAILFAVVAFVATQRVVHPSLAGEMSFVYAFRSSLWRIPGLILAGEQDTIAGVEDRHRAG